MKEIHLNIPSDLSEITLGDYNTIQDIFNNEEDLMKGSLRVISLLTQLTYGEVNQLSRKDFNDTITTITQVLNKECKWRQRFTINGTEYAFIPNLDDMSIGEYIDLDTYLKDPQDLHKVMTILYRPIKLERFGKYILEDYTGREDVDIMKFAPMDAVKGAFVFFYHLGKELLSVIPSYLEEQVLQTTQSNPTLQLSGDGILPYIHSLEEILTSSMIQQEEMYMNVLLSFPLKKKKQRQMEL